jgi:hypothetical protein
MFSCFNNKLAITADYFNNVRSDILWARNASVPLSTGINPAPEKHGKSGNKGFDFSVNYNNKAGRLTYQIGLNGGYAKNRIISGMKQKVPPLTSDRQVTRSVPACSTKPLVYSETVRRFQNIRIGQTRGPVTSFLKM